MQGLKVFLLLGILATWSCSASFFNNRPFPTYSLESMPITHFTCRDKILGGYYADPDAQCQMFHICVKVAGVGVKDFRFLCPNGTAFDQDHQICADWEDVDCDATTLYYASDNFDLYRLGSGFESKAFRYGEEEETFSLQRAETGDARLNREPQTQTVNQQKEYQRPQTRKSSNNNNFNQERDIFKASSSSNFFNNRNNGKETEEDYDDNVNINQNRDYEQKRKVIRKQFRRPVQQQNNQNNEQSSAPPPQQSSNNNRNTNARQGAQDTQKNTEVQQTRRPSRPNGFVNNFAGSSYAPSTQRPSTTTNEQYSTASSFNNNFRRGNRQRVSISSTTQNSPAPAYTVSTPAPFRQPQTTSTENYPQPQSTVSASINYNQNYDVPKASKNTENYPSNNPQYSKLTTPFAQFSTAYDKKSNSPKRVESKPTTFSPNAKPFSVPSNGNIQQFSQNIPTTLAPRTQQAYTQIAQQTNNYSNQNSQQTTNYNQQNTQQSYNNQKPQSPSTFSQFYSNTGTTQRSTTFTGYTPTVPKISPTTPVARSNRYDETQYDDGSYDPKYDSYGNEDEFLKTANSQNIASSRNELARAQKQQQQTSTTQRSYEAPRTYSTKQTENYPKSGSTRITQATPRSVDTKTPEPAPQPVNKKVKNVSYDYAYYDSFGSEPDYQIDTDIKKSVN